MRLNEFAGASHNVWRQKRAYLIASAFTAVVVAGSLSLTSCAHTQAGLQREQAVYLVASNAHQTLQPLVPYAPPPANSILEGVLAAGGALLALWATHLHRSLNDLRNGGPQATNGQGPVPAGEKPKTPS